MPFPILIVVPTLNSQSSHIFRLYDSLCQQSYPYWRILFVDGGSLPRYQHVLADICQQDSRCTVISQLIPSSRIFGAMNDGIRLSCDGEWVLFWGSDDYAASSDVLSGLVSALEVFVAYGSKPDMVVCRGRYLNANNGNLTRWSFFRHECSLNVNSFRSCLFFGSTPPHQATLFSSDILRSLHQYNEGYLLCADLDYYLRSTRLDVLAVECLDLDLVHMSDSGVSGQQTQRRLYEVYRAYSQAFGALWFIPFVFRYIRRLISLLISP